MKPLQAIKLFWAILIIPMLLSCSSDKLTRDKAKKLIIEKLRLPKDEIDDFCIESTNYNWASLTAKNLEKFQNEGLLTYTYEEVGFFGGGGAFGTLTEKGKKYAVSDKFEKGAGSGEMNISVKVAKLDFGEITGIVESKESNSAIVNYTLIRKEITPFGRLIKNHEEGVNNASASFIKYDDGWRINNNRE